MEITCFCNTQPCGHGTFPPSCLFSPSSFPLHPFLSGLYFQLHYSPPRRLRLEVSSGSFLCLAEAASSPIISARPHLAYIHTYIHTYDVHTSPSTAALLLPPILHHVRRHPLSRLPLSSDSTACLVLFFFFFFFLLLQFSAGIVGCQPVSQRRTRLVVANTFANTAIPCFSSLCVLSPIAGRAVLA